MILIKVKIKNNKNKVKQVFFSLVLKKYCLNESKYR